MSYCDGENWAERKITYSCGHIEVEATYTEKDKRVNTLCPHCNDKKKFEKTVIIRKKKL